MTTNNQYTIDDVLGILEQTALEETATEMKKGAGIPLEAIKRSDTAKSFKVLPKHWIVECTFGWLGRWRYIVHDVEKLARNHAAL